MTTKTIEWWQHGFPLVYDGKSAPYRYHRYPQDQWGIHLFMISRSYAKTLLEVYGPDYAARAYKEPSMICCNLDSQQIYSESCIAISYDGSGRWERKL